jgi:hypothetical protein
MWYQQKKVDNKANHFPNAVLFKYTCFLQPFSEFGKYASTWLELAPSLGWYKYKFQEVQ